MLIDKKLNVKISKFFREFKLYLLEIGYFKWQAFGGLKILILSSVYTN